MRRAAGRLPRPKHPNRRIDRRDPRHDPDRSYGQRCAAGGTDPVRQTAIITKGTNNDQKVEQNGRAAAAARCQCRLRRGRRYPPIGRRETTTSIRSSRPKRRQLGVLQRLRRAVRGTRPAPSGAGLAESGPPNGHHTFKIRDAKFGRRETAEDAAQLRATRPRRLRGATATRSSKPPRRPIQRLCRQVKTPPHPLSTLPFRTSRCFPRKPSRPARTLSPNADGIVRRVHRQGMAARRSGNPRRIRTSAGGSWKQRRRMDFRSGRQHAMRTCRPASDTAICPVLARRGAKKDPNPRSTSHRPAKTIAINHEHGMLPKRKCARPWIWR